MIRQISVLALAIAALGVAGAGSAETIAVDGGIAVKQADVPTPTRGMTMKQVEAKFGEPASKTPAVGKPPISRWNYAGFAVYFEYDHVIHSVVEADAPAAPAAPDAAPSS